MRQLIVSKQALLHALIERQEASMTQTAENLAQKAGQPELRITKRFERGLFGAPKSVAINATLSTKRPLPLGDILFRLGRSPRFHLHDVLGQNVPAEFINVRGRPPESFGSLLERPADGEEELLFVKGRIINTGKEVEEIAEGFEIRLRTKFSRFEGARQIIYGVTPDVRFPLGEPAPEPPAFLGYSVPLEISELRVGFELFYARFMGLFLGTAPIIKTRFYLDVSSQVLNLYVQGEQKQELPEALEGDIAALGEVLRGNGIELDLIGELRKAG